MKQSAQTWCLVLLALLIALSGVNTALLLGSNRVSPETPPALSSGEAGAQKPLPQEPGVSMFSWEDEPFRIETRAAFYTVLQALEITSVYQSFTDAALYTEDVQSFLIQARRMEMGVYYLTGAREWGLEEDGRSMLREIEKVAAYNRANTGAGTFEGIVLDVEPYLTEEWDLDNEGVLKRYVSGSKAAYQAAAAAGLRVVICIPNWLDAVQSELLEELIRDACDQVAVMNYNRSAEAKSIQNELDLACSYEKPIECIYEFQRPGVHELTENETYYSAGLGSARESFDALYQEMGYDQLSLSYHYYKPVAELYYLS